MSSRKPNASNNKKERISSLKDTFLKIEHTIVNKNKCTSYKEFNLYIINL